jgi:hypothetical protein
MGRDSHIGGHVPAGALLYLEVCKRVVLQSPAVLGAQLHHEQAFAHPVHLNPLQIHLRPFPVRTAERTVFNCAVLVLSVHLCNSFTKRKLVSNKV